MGPTEIRQLRTRLRLPQTEFAQLLGVHWTTVIRWEQGSLSPDPWRVELLQAMARARELEARKTREELATAGVVGALLLLLAAGSSTKGGRGKKG